MTGEGKKSVKKKSELKKWVAGLTGHFLVLLYLAVNLVFGLGGCGPDGCKSSHIELWSGKNELDFGEKKKIHLLLKKWRAIMRVVIVKLYIDWGH